MSTVHILKNVAFLEEYTHTPMLTFIPTQVANSKNYKTIKQSQMLLHYLIFILKGLLVS